MRLLLLLLLLLTGLGTACGGPPSVVPPSVVVSPAGVQIQVAEGGAGVVRAELLDPDGVPLVRQRLPAPTAAVELRHRLGTPGVYTVRLRDAQGRETEIAVPVAAPPVPLEVVVEAPVGQGRHSVADGDIVPVTVIAGQPTQVSVTLTALAAGAAWVAVDGVEVATRTGLRAGERLVAVVTLSGDGPARIAAGLREEGAEEGEGEGAQVSLQVVPQAVSAAAARAALQVAPVVFPADPAGQRDPTRPQGRVTLPAAWWQGVLRLLGLGFRSPGGDVPWAWMGVTLENSAPEAINVVVSARVVDAAGRPEPAFRPRMRDGQDPEGWVSVLLRVPGGSQARAALPLYVDARLLGAAQAAEGQWTHELTVTPIGATAALRTEQAPLYVSRGSAAASAGLTVAVLAAVLGLGLLVARLPRWLRAAQTSELMTVALFGALSFLVSAAGQLVGMGVGALLGPFSILVTGLVDDVLRYALWATLLTLLPRPGIAALALLTHWLLSGVAMGAFSPTDVLFVGGRVLWLEGALWLVGVTRRTGWLQQGRLQRWLRLSLGFGVASVASSATGLVLHVTLYRLFLADWYVAMVLLGPGFLYVVLACWVATPFAASLRQIQR